MSPSRGEIDLFHDTHMRKFKANSLRSYVTDGFCNEYEIQI